MLLYMKKVTDKAYCLQTRLGPSKLSQTITSSPPSPPLRPSSSPQIPTQSTSRPIKPRPNPSSTRAPAPTPEVPFTPDITDMPAPVSVPPPDTFSVSAGAKRRHAMMMMLDQTAPSEPAASTSTGAPRRRTKSTRGSAAGGAQNQNVESMMDVEEDGRERKRVARR